MTDTKSDEISRKKIYYAVRRSNILSILFWKFCCFRIKFEDIRLNNFLCIIKVENLEIKLKKKIKLCLLENYILSL